MNEKATIDDDFLIKHIATAFVICCPRCGRYGVIRGKDEHGWYHVVWRDRSTLPAGKLWEDYVLPSELLDKEFGCGFDSDKREVAETNHL